MSGATPVSVSMSSAAFEPWVAYWASEVLPAAQWQSGVDLYVEAGNIDSGAVGETIGFVFDALPGVLYQIAAATSNYNPTPLGAYSLLIETPTTPFDTSTVPLPAPASLLVAALAGLWGARRTRR